MLNSTRSACFALLGGILFMAGVSHPIPVSAQPNGIRTVTCHSNDHEYQRCNIHGWDDARLLRQASRASCLRGEDWGIDGEWLWVTDGCRAEFAEVRSPRRTVRLIDTDWTRSCASKDRQHHTCPVGPWDDAELIEQHSRTPCIRDKNWGLDGTSIWVDDGCRGVFAKVDYQQVPVRPGHGLGTRPRTVDRLPHRRLPPTDRRHEQPTHDAASETVRFTCESQDLKYHHCPVRIGPNGTVEVDKVLSKSECQPGHSWGWSTKGIWVDHGCRARFVIHR